MLTSGPEQMRTAGVAECVTETARYLAGLPWKGEEKHMASLSQLHALASDASRPFRSCKRGLSSDGLTIDKRGSGSKQLR